MPNTLSREQRQAIRKVVAPVACLVAVLILTIIAIALLLADRQNQDALARQRELAQGMVQIRLAELSKTVNDYAHWDEALDKLVLHPDLSWADMNVGPTTKERLGIDMVFVVDASGRTTYGMTNSLRSVLPTDRILSTGFDRILRARQSAGPDAPASGIALSHGRPALVAVAPLRPHDGAADTSRDRRSVLAFVDLLDDAQLDELSRVFRLPNLRVVDGEAEDDASTIITTFDGTVPVRLAWDGDDPGGRLLDRILPPLLGLLAVFAGFAVFVLRQATKAGRNLRLIEEEAVRDPLTGLWNRSKLMRDLDRKFDGPAMQSFSLLYLDLDGFKAINDTYGHGVGDSVLLRVGRRMTEALANLAEAYRLGGDEFAILVPDDVDAEPARSIGARIIATLSVPMQIDDLFLRIGVTIGVAVAGRDGRSPAEIIRHADEALYVGKRSGRGCIFSYGEIGETSRPAHRLAGA